MGAQIKKPLEGALLVFSGAGDGNRTRVTSLEGWSSTIELHPHCERPRNHEETLYGKTPIMGNLLPAAQQRYHHRTASWRSGSIALDALDLRERRVEGALERICAVPLQNRLHLSARVARLDHLGNRLTAIHAAMQHRIERCVINA